MAFIEVLVDGPDTTITPTDATEHTEFEIGSVTKIFTDELLRLKIARGEMNEHTTVGHCLGNNSPIRLVDLAEHTSGLPRLGSTGFSFVNDFRHMFAGTNPYVGITTKHVLDDALSASRWRRPFGAKGMRMYSNLGVSVLGHCLAKAEGTDYNTLLRKELLDPLNMHETYLMLPGTVGANAQRGVNVFKKEAEPWEMEGYTPCGAIRSTGADMEHWMRYLLENLPSEGRPLGWFKKGRFVWHDGMTFGFTSNLALDRTRGRAAFTSHAGMNGASNKVFKMLRG